MENLKLLGEISGYLFRRARSETNETTQKALVEVHDEVSRMRREAAAQSAGVKITPEEISGAAKVLNLLAGTSLNGSNETVTVFEDEACRTWHIQIGDRIMTQLDSRREFWAHGLAAALRKAVDHYEAQAEEEEAQIAANIAEMERRAKNPPEDQS